MSKSNSSRHLDKFERFRRYENMRKKCRNNEFSLNRRNSTEHSFGSNFDGDNTKYQSCLSLHSTKSDILRTPKRSKSLNFFQSHISLTERISDYYSENQHSHLMNTPEVQLACSSNSATAQFFWNTIQAVGMCLLVWKIWHYKSKENEASKKKI